MTNLAAINSREDFKYVIAGKVINGENTYETRVFEANDKPLHDLIGDNKEAWGIVNNPSGHPGKFRQIACAEAQMELGIPVDYYNGATIDGLTHRNRYLNAKEYTPEKIMEWMTGLFIDWKDGVDIANSKAAREQSNFTFMDYNTQLYNLLRNKHSIDYKYRNMIEYHIDYIFEPTNNMLNNSIFAAPDTYQEVRKFHPASYRIPLRGSIKVRKKLFEQVINDSKEFEYENLENGCTIMISNKMVLNIKQLQNGTYNLKNVLNGAIVTNCPSLSYIYVFIFQLRMALKKTLLEGVPTPTIYIIPSNYHF